MVQQMLARQQEDHEAAVSKRKLEEQERALELQQKRQALEAEAAAQRLKLAKVSTQHPAPPTTQWSTLLTHALSVTHRRPSPAAWTRTCR